MKETCGIGRLVPRGDIAWPKAKSPSQGAANLSISTFVRRPRGDTILLNSDVLADLERDQVLAEFNRPAISLSRLGHDFVQTRRRDLSGAPQDEVRVDRHFGLGPSEH